MKRIYIYSGLFGICGGLLLIFSQAIPWLGNLLETIYNLLVVVYSPAEKWNAGFQFVVFTLPFFLIFLFTPQFLKTFKHEATFYHRFSFLFFSFLFFSLGAVVSYGIWIAIVFIAASNWTLF